MRSGALPFPASRIDTSVSASADRKSCVQRKVGGCGGGLRFSIDVLRFSIDLRFSTDFLRRSIDFLMF